MNDYDGRLNFLASVSVALLLSVVVIGLVGTTMAGWTLSKQPL